MAEVRAVRLIAEYDGDQIRLVSQQEVDVEVDLQEPVPLAPGELAVETRGSEDSLLQRVILPVLAPHSVEVFPEDPSGHIERIDVDRPVGAFTVVVPVTDDARRVAVVRGWEEETRSDEGPPSAGERPAAAGEVLATFDLAAGATGEETS
jgi:hypothetical protein